MRACGSLDRIAVRCVVLALISVLPASAQVLLPQNPTKPSTYSAEELSLLTPKSANPYLSNFAPGVEPDWEYWRSAVQVESQQRSATSALAPVPLVVSVSDSEPNDTFVTANFVAGFGTGAGDDPAMNITGTITSAVVPTGIGPFTDATDDGTISDGSIVATELANDISPVSSGQAVTFDGVIGDGLHGSGGDGRGDFDFFRINGVLANSTISVDVDSPLSTLDSVVIIYDATGVPLAFNDDTDSTDLDSFASVVVPALGDYFVMIGGFHPQGVAPADLLDPQSGPGAGSEGAYTMTIGVDTHDVDFYSFDLDAGDVLGAVGTTAGNVITLYDPSSAKRIASSQDLSGLYPAISPLPGSGVDGGVLAYVVETTGTYALSVTSTTGAYGVQLRAFRPPLDSAGIGVHQKIFIDFDGATVDRAVVGGIGTSTLSPLSAFLANWGLISTDESAVISSILATVVENIQTDVGGAGLNPNFQVEILNSRDDADPFGTANVSRVVVGGTALELGVPAGLISTSESVDVGNFNTSETAVVLLDVLSGPQNPDPGTRLATPVSINDLDSSATTVINLIGVTIGNFVSHEIGHLSGNFHTDNANLAALSIMDESGASDGLRSTIGTGPDGILGAGADDIDVDLTTDVYLADEFFSGTQDELNVVSFDLSTNPPGGPVPLRVWPVAFLLAVSGAAVLLRRRSAGPR